MRYTIIATNRKRTSDRHVLGNFTRRQTAICHAADLERLRPGYHYAVAPVETLEHFTAICETTAAPTLF